MALTWINEETVGEGEASRCSGWLVGNEALLVGSDGILEVSMFVRTWTSMILSRE